MNSLYKILYVLALSGIFFIPLTWAHAVVPTWDTGASGPAPLVGPVGVGAPPGHQASKEHSIIAAFSLESLTSLIPSWDAVARGLATAALNALADDVIGWINSGFQDNPAFLQDPEGFLAGVGDAAAGEFIQQIGTELAGNENFLCDFRGLFELSLKAGFRRRPFKERVGCSISGAIENLERFQEDFTDGGWDRWFELRQPNNNVFGATITLLNEKQSLENLRIGNWSTESLWGDGFLGKKQCVQEEKLPEGAAGPPQCIKYETITPGRAIADRLEHTVGSDFGQIIDSDEMSEIIDSLINALINQALKQGVLAARG